MKFIVGNDVVELDQYGSLKHFISEYKVCEYIIEFLDKWFDETVGEIEFKTSGSTGSPKVITHTKNSMIVSAQLTQKAFGYKKNDTALLCLPVQYISGCMMLVRSIVSDLDLVISEISTYPLSKVKIDSLDQIDFAPMTPMQFENLYILNVDSLGMFKNILLGGAQVNRLQLEMIDKVMPDVFIGYGMTETITHLALKKLNNKPDSYYCVLDGFKIEKNKADCLVATADHLPNEIITNDVIDLVSSNEFLWKGRADNIINSGGLKINPEELEILIGEHLSDNFFITSLPDNTLGEMTVCVIEKHPFKFERERYLYIENIRKTLLEMSLGNKRPRQLFFQSSFLLTESGKINRKAIQKLLTKDSPITI